MSDYRGTQPRGASQPVIKTILRVVVVVMAAAVAGALAMWKPGSSGQDPEPKPAPVSVVSATVVTPLVMPASADPAPTPLQAVTTALAPSAVAAPSPETTSAEATKVSPAPTDGPQSVAQIDYKLLLQTKTRLEPPPEYPDDLKNLDGKRVRISGFMAPLDSMDDMTNFMLLETPVGCYFCSPPDPTTVLLVRQKPDKKAPFLYDPVAVEGVLHLWKSDPSDPMLENFLFTVDQAQVAPEPEAK